MNATAFSQTGCSDLASAPELSPSGARAAATSPSAFMNKPHPFPTLTKPPFLQNLTHTTPRSQPQRRKLGKLAHKMFPTAACSITGGTSD